MKDYNACTVWEILQMYENSKLIFLIEDGRIVKAEIEVGVENE